MRLSTVTRGLQSPVPCGLFSSQFDGDEGCGEKVLPSGPPWEG